MNGFLDETADLILLVVLWKEKWDCGIHEDVLTCLLLSLDYCWGGWFLPHIGRREEFFKHLHPISPWERFRWQQLLPRRRQCHSTPVLLTRKSHGWRSLEGCSPWGRWGLEMTEQLHFHFSLSRIGHGNGNPLQCSCLENPRDGGTWWAAVYGVAQSRTRLKRLSSSSSSSSSYSQEQQALLQLFLKLCLKRWEKKDQQWDDSFFFQYH